MNWTHISDPQDPELDRLADKHGFHPLHIEDCRHRGQSAKIEEDSYIFVVLKSVELAPDGSLSIGDFDLFLGRDFLVTVQEADCGHVDQLLARVRPGARDLRPDQLFYRLLDGLIDSYLPTLDGFSDTIDQLEDEVLARPDPAVLQRIFDTKRGLVEMRRLLVNTRDVAGHLQRSDSQLIARDMWPFLRDVYDHVARGLDMVEMERDLLAGALDIYLSSVANRTNQVVKVLTVLSTIALPALVISSFYGMNLRHLPAAESPHATGLVFLVMVLSTFGLLWLLKALHWL